MSDLHELNRSYLIIVRDAVKTDKASACAKFNIDQSFAETLSQMSLMDIASAAETNDVLFRPTMTGLSFKKLMVCGDRTARTVLATMARGSVPDEKAHA